MRASRIVIAATALVLLLASGAPASHTPPPTVVAVAGSLQSELGCPGDWDPGCAATHLAYDAADEVWQRSFTVPAGSWEYKAAAQRRLGRELRRQRDPRRREHRAHARRRSGPSSSTTTTRPTGSRTASRSTIAVAPGSFQSELGCPGDWDPSCLRSWLQDPDGDGTYTFATTVSPGRQLRGQGRDQRRLGRELRRRAASPAGRTSRSPSPPVRPSMFSLRRVDARPDDHSHQPGPGHDGNVEWDGLRHDSRDLLYRTPGGAVPAGTPVKLRLRTFHDDVTSVVGARLRRERQRPAASCRWRSPPRTSPATSASPSSAATSGRRRCRTRMPNNLWYRFIVSDGADTDYYGDNTAALDGGLGAASEDPVDRSWALTVHEPGFVAPAWARSAVIYQIFPDRFRNGTTKNDPEAGDPRYDDPVTTLPWDALPEGYCRNYRRAQLPWRFDKTPPQPDQSPRGRDYFGGDLKGVNQKLDYLQHSASTAIYFNPIFEAKLEPPLRHGRLREDRPGARHRAGVQEARQGRREARHPRSSSTASSTTCRPTARSSTATTTTSRSEPASRCPRAYRDWFVFRPRLGWSRAWARRTARATRLVRLRLDPGAAEDEPRRPGLLPQRPRHVTRHWLKSARPAGGWT